MSVHIARAQVLLQQARSAEAERELLLALAQSPENPLAHALLALAQSDQDKRTEALTAARAAVGLAPDTGYFHYVHAQVLHRLERDTEALAAVGQAIRLDPEDEEEFALLASIHLARRNWSEALSAAEQGLALNPEHIGSANLRAMALVRLGRKAEAAQTVDFALERAPENAFSHANQGWNCLHQNDPRTAQEHFREALRLEPDLEYARQGMLEALKARNAVYRIMLSYFLWIGRQGAKFQWFFIVATYIAVRYVSTLTAAHGWLWPVVISLYLFIYLSWTAGPMFNLLLRIDRFGRYVLSRDERIATNWFASAVALLAFCLIWRVFNPSELLTLGAYFSAAISVCLSMTFARSSRRRIYFGWATGALAVTALLTLAFLAARQEPRANTLFNAFLFGFVGMQLAANFVRR